MNPSAVFLTAEWRRLAIVNYEASPDLLQRFLPRGVELDLWQGRCLVSVVGFQFRDTRLHGIPIPFHRNFPEVNLRFYVRRRVGDEVRRGVVFIRELVPRRAIALVARALYNEPYLAVPMTESDDGARVQYAWTHAPGPGRVAVTTEGLPSLPSADSEEAFIVEHYWGYTRQRDGGTLEYQVEHPPWRVWSGVAGEFQGDIDALYGSEFRPVLEASPVSALVAEGSPIRVRHGVPLRHSS